jgi:hypothetical protein
MIWYPLWMTVSLVTITLVLVLPQNCWTLPGGEGYKVQYKQTAWFIISIFIVLGILGALASVAIPHSAEMAYASKADKRTMELFTIQTAVAEMLSMSQTHQVNPIGPTANMNLVFTTDKIPLALAGFLPNVKNGRIDSGYNYSFTADGLVLQYGE